MKLTTILSALEYGWLPYLIIIAFLFYLLPAIIAFSKNRHNKTAVLVLNIFLGWTLIGWIVSLVWAVSNKSPQQIIVNNSQFSSDPIKNDAIETLSKLNDLRANGVITDEEFNIQKNKLFKN